MYFRNYRLRETLVNCVKKTTFGGPFNKQHVKRFQTVLRSQPQCLYQIYWLLCTELSRKKSLLVIWKILRLFVTTLSAEEKYSLLNRDNLMQPIHMQLSQEQKTFSWSFFLIFEIYIKFWTSSKKRWHS